MASRVRSLPCPSAPSTLQLQAQLNARWPTPQTKHLKALWSRPSVCPRCLPPPPLSPPQYKRLPKSSPGITNFPGQQHRRYIFFHQMDDDRRGRKGTEAHYLEIDVQKSSRWWRQRSQPRALKTEVHLQGTIKMS